MKKRNLMHRFLIATLLVGAIFMTAPGNNAYADSVMGSGGYTGSNSAGGMLGSGTFVGNSDDDDAPRDANAVETTSAENGDFEEILDAFLEFFF